MKYDCELQLTSPFPEVGDGMSGYVFEDTATHGNHPFKDGIHVYTTAVKEIVEEEGDTFFVTRNTTYKLS